MVQCLEAQKNQFAIKEKMKNIICSFWLFSILLAVSQIASAEIQCIRPELSATLYFGNGIKTDLRSAKASLARLETEIGPDYNSHALSGAFIQCDLYVK